MRSWSSFAFPVTVALVAALGLAACANQPCAPQVAQPLAKTPPATAAPVPPLAKALQAHPPFRYVVQPGDTLWGISSRFLRSPWLWAEIWYENPYIHNPHLIYPGDVITLTYPNGEAALSISRGGTMVATTSAELGTRFVAPKVRVTPLAHAIPTIPYDEIAPLLSKPRVMGAEAYASAPYVLRPLEDRLLAASPGSIYARGLDGTGDDPGSAWAVVEKTKVLKEPPSGCSLGYEVAYLGRAEVRRAGDPTSLQLVQSTQEIKPGDRLVPVETGVVPSQFPLLAPNVVVDADIIDVIGGLEEVGQYQVVVLDRGSQSGLRMGDVLAIYRRGEWMKDPYAHGNLSGSVLLPNERSGHLVVFKVFPQVSFALVMSAQRPIRINDFATNP
ncbi:MAG TPA: LysM domain-containing protein [Gammaproteobacteria bacterium]|nr:LysM domain-containing protein [Gammaproteobacteria bacterium]